MYGGVLEVRNVEDVQVLQPSLEHLHSVSL